MPVSALDRLTSPRRSLSRLGAVIVMVLVAACSNATATGTPTTTDTAAATVTPAAPMTAHRPPPAHRHGRGTPAATGTPGATGTPARVTILRPSLDGRHQIRG